MVSRRLDQQDSRDGRRVCIVGSGTRFLSGISYFTWHLASSLADRMPVSVILMRRLIPRFLYPGKERVGERLAAVEYPPEVAVYDGVDWYWVPTIFGAIAFLVRARPTHIVFQWWTGAVLHSFLLLTVVGRLVGARIVIEFHEVQDSGEAQFLAARRYVRAFARLLMRLADGFVIHSEFDRAQLEQRFGIGRRAVAVIPHGPYDHHQPQSAIPRREAPPEAFNFLFFGTIRPYKGLEDLIEAFEALSDEAPERFWLTVIGETWEGWTTPATMIRGSRHRERITFVNRYVADAEADGWIAGADAFALPYRRSSASGPLHLAMSAGLPIVVTAVGGLPEAAGNYAGAVFVKPADPMNLAGGLRAVTQMRHERFADPHTWGVSSDRLLDLLDSIDRRQGLAPPTDRRSL